MTYREHKTEGRTALIMTGTIQETNSLDGMREEEGRSRPVFEKLYSAQAGESFWYHLWTYIILYLLSLSTPNHTSDSPGGHPGLLSWNGVDL